MGETLPPWYHGCMNAEEATAICLKVGQNGAFLVRQSQGVKGAFTLSLFFEDEVYHHRIKKTEENRFVLGLNSGDKEFNSLEGLVHNYMSPREEFIHPLTVAIYPSLLKQLNENSQNWRSNIGAAAPIIYEGIRTGTLPGGTLRTVIPKPGDNPPPLPTSPTPSPAYSKMPASGSASGQGNPQSGDYDEVCVLPQKNDGDKAPTSAVHTSRPPPLPRSTSESPTPARNEDNCPVSPSPINPKRTAPPVIQPKPKNTKNLQRSPSDAAHKSKSPSGGSQQISYPNSTHSTFGKTGAQETTHTNLTRTESARPRSCVLPPSQGIQLVYDIPDDSAQANERKLTRRRTASLREERTDRSQGRQDRNVYDIPDDAGQANERKLTRRHTVSLREKRTDRSQGWHDKNVVTEQKSERINSPILPTNTSKNISANKTKSGHNKKSKGKLKSFAAFLNRITTRNQPSRQIAPHHRPEQYAEKVCVETNEEGENKEQEIKVEEAKQVEQEEKVYENSNGTNENVEANMGEFEDFTPILCKTRFVAILSYNSEDSAMNFTKGTEMAVKGVRIDGWWYCHNMTTKESGWVYMDYLTPMSHEKWFEAKPVETTRDYEIYQNLEFDSNYDSDFDDDHYCQYMAPGAAASAAGGEDTCDIGNF